MPKRTYTPGSEEEPVQGHRRRVLKRGASTFRRSLQDPQCEDMAYAPQYGWNKEEPTPRHPSGEEHEDFRGRRLTTRRPTPKSTETSSPDKRRKSKMRSEDKWRSPSKNWTETSTWTR